MLPEYSLYAIDIKRTKIYAPFIDQIVRRINNMVTQIFMVYVWVLQNILHTHLICVFVCLFFLWGGGAIRIVLDDAYNNNNR